MLPSNEIFSQFTSPWRGDIKVYKQLEIFAKSLGWYPSDIVEEKSKDSLTTGHLFVEHGLDNAAVISFLNGRFAYDRLTTKQQLDLLNVSYNNLVDLHIPVDSLKVYWINNRAHDSAPIYTGRISDRYENLRSDFYLGIQAERRIRINVSALDDVLINTISNWKRIIYAELGGKISNEELSNLFNAVILCRAIEDNYYKDSASKESPALIEMLFSMAGQSISAIIQATLKKFGIAKWPTDLINKSQLDKCDNINHSLREDFFKDFYLVRDTPYEYNFSIISKHALSRIYERYVSLLSVENTPQTSLYPVAPLEHKNKSSGSYYTPQFIARFFDRYIEQQISDYKFRNLKIVEPSVGSGIFLRTLLESKSNALESYNQNIIDKDFESVFGIDINPTACHSAKLSLSLLYLSYTGKLPEFSLNIVTQNSLDFFGPNKADTADICISNPPFVAHNRLSKVERDHIKKFLGETAYGKSDLYLPFIKIALDILKPGGIGLFVLPNTFLVSDSAKKLRAYLSEHAFIRCIVDLTDINVFDDTGIYPILLIFEKTSNDILRQRDLYGNQPLVTIAKIQENVGKALFDILAHNNTENISYKIYEVNQKFFKSENWFLLPPSEYSLKAKLENLPKLEAFAEVRTGFSSGGSDIFLINRKLIPKEDLDIYVPYLSDREMVGYSTPKNTDEYLFYPFENNELISEDDLRTNYDWTYSRLLQKKKILSARNEVKEGKIKWWQPQRPRKPSFMMVPKILSPHLVLSPKFCIDVNGKFAVSRGPFIVLKDGAVSQTTNPDILYYLNAVLNSSVCFWYLLNHAPKYQHGYAMLERKYLSQLPIPDPSIMRGNKIPQIIKLVKERNLSSGAEALAIEKKIDLLVTELYGLNQDEINFLNLTF